jgi:hypothetical protein
MASALQAVNGPQRETTLGLVMFEACWSTLRLQHLVWWMGEAELNAGGSSAGRKGGGRQADEMSGERKRSSPGMRVAS